MNKLLISFLVLALFGSSCGSKLSNFLSKKTPHEEYAEKLEDRGLEKTPAGRAWLAASKKALEQPYAIEVPFKLKGYFATDKPRALGLQFTATRGQRLTFNITKNETKPFVLYAELFKQDGESHALIQAVDTAQTEFYIDIDEPGPYVLRLQPELFLSGAYSLSVATGPSLLFPVTGAKAKAGSFWGASRGGGKRSHEGVDIFAPKRTPVVAAADGVVTGVKEAGIGGKVVWLRLKDKNVTLYYAHLDKQLVREGQEVKKGETVGLVGNTGNAKLTPSHLHFGVYTSAGPIDPYPFVNPLVQAASPVPDKKLTTLVRLNKPQKMRSGETISKQTLMVPLAVTNEGYLTELPGGTIAQFAFSAVSTVTPPLKKETTTAGKNTNGASTRM